jgi:hypothetical protein
MKNSANIFSDDFPAHWENFADRLQTVFDGKTIIQDEREKYVLALLAFSKLLRQIDPDPRTSSVNEIAARFQELAEALQDVVDGIPHPMFKAIVKRGRTPDPRTVWRIRATVCVALEYLSRAGIDDCVGFAIRKHRRRLERLLRTNTTLESSIRAWRRNFASEQVQDEAALEIYKRGIEMLGEQTDDDMRAIGEALLEKAATRTDQIVKT